MWQRVFTGWDEPFVHSAANWLLERRESLPGLLVVVPTSQSGRRLREAMAETAGALLSPQIVTPAWFLSHSTAACAPDWVERLAWLETLEQAAKDWSPYLDFLPEAPDPGNGSADGLARELTRLRKRLQENGHTLASAARALSNTPDAARWTALARLEARAERQLAAWNQPSRSQTLARGIAIPPEIHGMALAGVTDLPPLIESTLAQWPGPVTLLIGAPASEADHFSESGRPLPVWTERPLDWPAEPQGSVILAADPRQQALEAFRAVCRAGTPSNEVALGSADPETAAELERAFTRGSWTAFNPAATRIPTGLLRFLTCWREWLLDPRLTVARDLLALPETTPLVGGRREQHARTLARLRDQSLAKRPEDLERWLTARPARKPAEQELADALMDGLKRLLDIRNAFATNDFQNSLRQLMRTIRAQPTETLEIDDWLFEATPLLRRLDRSAAFWLGLLLDELPCPAPSPPDQRVIDVQGWLELVFEPGRHLVLCGLNEGRLPSVSTADPWLGEPAAARLGLLTDSSRAARDAFLLHALLAARRTAGRADLLCAKHAGDGSSLLPSRLLLSAPQAELPGRVKFLFRELEPPEAGLRWHADWKWQTPAGTPPARLRVTSFSSWLACPFRFYLKHVLDMQAPEPERIEWNARDFGTLAHDLLELWANDPEAREFNKTEALAAWFSHQLDARVAAWFGRQPPLAIRLQTEALRQRLFWLARSQAITRAEGWETIAIETPFEIELAGGIVSGRIDRIDRHRDDGRLRVIDYKTGKLDNVAQAHRRRLNSSSKLPAHLTDSCPACYQGTDKGKAASFRWINLQLPLYVHAIRQQQGVLAEPCYFAIGQTEAQVGLVAWADFSPHDLTAALDCAEWVTRQIQAKVFWPPAEKADHDDFAALAAGKDLATMFTEPPAPA